MKNIYLIQLLYPIVLSGKVLKVTYAWFLIPFIYFSLDSVNGAFQKRLKMTV